MKNFKLLLLDIVIILVATVLAQLLRDNFEIVSTNMTSLAPYVVATLISSLVVIPALGLHRSVWRFSTMHDYLMLAGASAAIVLGALLLAFGFNRLEGTARSIPILQFLTALVLLAATRVFARIKHANRKSPRQFASAENSDPIASEAMVIVGLNRLTELFLQSVQEFNSQGMNVAGLIGSNPSHTGRLMHRYPVLGEASDLPEILKDLRVHGILVTRIVVTQRVSTLPPAVAQVLRELASASDVRVDFLAVSLGLDDQTAAADGETAASSESENVDRMLRIGRTEQEALAQRPYWRIKQAADIAGAFVILTLMTPVILITAVIVALDMGRPILFWQQRPGLGGKPFRVYKFRTMRAAFDSDGRLLSDSERVSFFGNLLRRTRLDELPQLFNILIGQMSFIGPRPLLPIDQPVGAATRLLVRPGLTGWAQVKGGRHLTATDKAALDAWYVRNASFAVDVEIMWRTVLMVIFGEREDTKAVECAWADLARATASAREIQSSLGRSVSGEMAA